MPVFNYVGSGMAHTRLANNSAEKDPITIDVVRHVAQSIQNKNNHKISVLFNAFTEKKLAETFDVFFNGTMQDVFSDSGGLQVITLGKVITDELKSMVYALQGKMSDKAMCFDEIPVTTYNNSKQIGQSTKIISEKRYDKNLFVPCLEKTKSNLVEQINYFLEHNSRAKVLPILQGNTIDEYLLWNDTLIKDLSREQKSKIDAISISTFKTGFEIQGTIQICKVLKHLQTDTKNIHLLGFGSIKRFIPFIILSLSGYFEDKYDEISYDSTSHTHSSSRGKYLKKNNEALILDRYRTDKYYMAWEDFKSNMKESIDYLYDKHGIEFTEDHFYYTICDQKNYESWGKHLPSQRGIFTFMYFVSQVLNFTWTINELCTNRKYLKEFIELHDPTLLYLFEVKTDSDLDRWLKYTAPSDKQMDTVGADANDFF